MARQRRTGWTRAVALWMLVSFVGSSLPVAGQVVPPPIMPGAPRSPAPGVPGATAAPPDAAESGGGKMISLNFRDAPLDQVLQFYAELTGRTLIKSPGINATITLRSQNPLAQSDAMQAIESVLAMNNVTMVPMGTKFLKVVQPTAARQEGLQISGQLPEKPFPETDHLISQIITLKYLEIADAQTVIQGFLHGYGKIQPLERMNSLLITETSANLQRILEILEYIDQPAEAKIETRIYELKYAEAAKIASRLNELIADAQGKEEKPRVAAPGPVAPSPPGVIRARLPQPAARAEAAETELAERGIVQGKVKIVADERTNILIVIARPSNFSFFDKIVAILDRPVEPEITVRVVALEYAKAEEVASILNEFVGAAKAESKVTPPQAGAPAAGGEAEAARSQALQDYIARRSEERLRAAVSEEKTRIGQLSPNTKILADKRTNSLLLMGTKSDVAALEDVIDKLDTMLAQVLIEAVILEVGLNKRLEYGLDWLQRSMISYKNNGLAGPNGGVLGREPLFSYGGGSRMGDGTTFRDGASVQRNDPVIGAGGLTYYTTIYDLNIDAVIRMVAGSSDARILSTPVILTTDNTEAKIIVGEERPVVTSTSTSDAGQQTSSYEYRNIGINLTVTPRINPQRFVVMEISQTADNVGGFEVIDGNNVPIITKREMHAQIAVPSRSTIALGGLVSTDRRKTRAKVPILGDIPVIGTLFRADTESNNRTELLVLLTPYVLTSPEEAQRETERLHSSTRGSQTTWYRGWSDSPLTRPSAEQVREEKKAQREGRRQRALFERRGEPAPEPTQDFAPKVTVVVPSEMGQQADVVTAAPEPQEPAAQELPAEEPPAQEPPPVIELQPAAPAPEPAAVPEPAALEPLPLDDDDPGAPVPLN